MEAASSFALIFFYINECADEFLGPLMPATTQFLREKKDWTSLMLTAIIKACPVRLIYAQTTIGKRTQKKMFSFPK